MTARERDPRFAVAAGLILVAAAALIIPFSGNHIIGVDGIGYERYAKNLVDHSVFSPAASAPFEPSIYRTPGYPLFLAALRLIGGGSVVIVRIAQFLLLGVLAWLVYGIAHQLGDRRTARIAALMCVTYLPFLWIARMHLTETLTAVLLTATVLLLMRRGADVRPWRHAAIGALIACTALVRPVYAIAIVPIALGILIWREGAPPRQVAVRLGAMGAAFVLVLVPWTVRNLNLTHQFRPFGVGGGGTSLLASAMQYQGTLGYQFGPADLHKLDAAEAPLWQVAFAKAAREKSDVPLSVRKEIEADRADRRQAHAIFKNVSLTDVVKRIPKREAYLWAVSDYPPTSHYTLWHNLARLEHFLLLAFALVGLIAGLIRLGLGALWPVALFPVYLMVVHLYVHSEGRYTLPVRPALMAAAALGVVYAWNRVAVRRRAAEAQ